MRRVIKTGVFAGAMLASFAIPAGAAMYNGNGATGFGGALGNGSLSITNDPVSGNITFTLNNASGFSSNDVVVYIDSVAGGFADTSQFSDNGDGGRESISAANNGNPSRELITFPTGFTADYALEFENDTFDGLFGLVAGGNNSLNYITGNGPSTVGGPYVVTFPLSDIGVAPGGSFSIAADLISTSAYGSNETIGASTTNAGAGGNPAFSGTLDFTSVNTFTASVPEPASIGLIGGMSVLLLRRRGGAIGTSE
jgi:hypothetical protein